MCASLNLTLNELFSLFNFNQDEEINIYNIQDKVVQLYDKINYFNDVFNKSKNKSKDN